MAKYEFTAENRTQFGTGPSRRMQRVENKIPAVVYGAGKDPEAIILDHQMMLQALENDAVFSSILTLNINAKPQKVILKDIQRHPFKPRVQHMDFLRINENEKLTIHVPIHYKGEAVNAAVKSGAVISKHMNEVEIRCLPADLPEHLEIDVAQMALGDSIHLTDLQLPKGVELAIIKLDDAHDQPVVSVIIPKAVKEEEITPAAEAAAAPGAEAKESKEAKPGAKEEKKS